jgi:hypothetical protein
VNGPPAFIKNFTPTKGVFHMRTLRLLQIAMVVALTACTTANKKTQPDPNEPPPKMLSPLVKKIWIPPAIKNGGLEWESGHFLYRIDRSPTWAR